MTIGSTNATPASVWFTSYDSWQDFHLTAKSKDISSTSFTSLATLVPGLHLEAHACVMCSFQNQIMRPLGLRVMQYVAPVSPVVGTRKKYASR